MTYPGRAVKSDVADARLSNPVMSHMPLIIGYK